MIETSRLKIYAASKEQMEAFIANQTVDILKAAYTEMLGGSLAHPDQNIASQKVLKKSGFESTGRIGEEGPIFIIK